jgi:hypothetical protein
MKKKIIIGLLILLVAIQFIRPVRNEGKPEGPDDITHYMDVPDNVMLILKKSCYDCHSDKTNYPWYAQINPFGLWLDHHVKEGKAELNFSDFSQYSEKKIDHKMEEIVEVIEEGEMPVDSYVLMHAEAELTEGEMAVIKDWVQKERAELKNK